MSSAVKEAKLWDRGKWFTGHHSTISLNIVEAKKRYLASWPPFPALCTTRPFHPSPPFALTLGRRKKNTQNADRKNMTKIQKNTKKIRKKYEKIRKKEPEENPKKNGVKTAGIPI
jgi:hypothetical protein